MPEPSQFDRDLSLARVPSDTDALRFTGAFAERWFIDRAVRGGQVIAAVVRAIEAAVGDPERTLRSITHHYLLPATAGPFSIEVSIDRHGRTLTNVSATLRQDGKVVGSSLAALGATWDSYEWDHPTMPAVPAPEQCPDFWGGTGGFVNLHRQWEYGHAIGPRLRSSTLGDPARPETVSGGWLRLKDPRPVDAALAACLTDTWPPGVFAHLGDEPVIFPTVDLTVQLLRPLPEAGDDGTGHCLVWHRLDTARAGWVLQDTEVWTQRGVLIARGRQHALLIRR
jgi:acyl-CoA thioesterase